MLDRAYAAGTDGGSASSVAISGIVGDDEHRTYTSETLAEPSTQLIYLMGAATAWDESFFEDGTVQATLAAMHVRERDREDLDCLDQCLAATCADDPEVHAAAARFMTLYRQFIADRLPANWAEVFAALRPS